MIRMKNVNKYFGDHHVLQNVSLDIAEGEKVVIIGPSGSGKSTLIRCMNQLEDISNGEASVNGFDLTNPKTPILEVRQKVAMVFQNFNLYSHKTILENVTLAPIKVQTISKADAERTGMEYLEKVGIADKAHAYPSQLSGGQQQRVAIARALNMHPEVLLFDEPTSALDPETIQEVLEVMEKLSELNITMVVVTHEMGFARKVADRIIFMDKGQIIETAAPDIFFTENKSQRARDFLSKIISN